MALPERVLISDEVGPATVMAGFIYQMTGDLGPNPRIVIRADRRTTEELQKETFSLLTETPLNPFELRNKVRSSKLDPTSKFLLKPLLSQLEVYRRYPTNQWWRLGMDLSGLSPVQRALHQLVVLDLLNYSGDPKAGFSVGIRSLAEFVEERPFPNREFMDVIEDQIDEIFESPSFSPSEDFFQQSTLNTAPEVFEMAIIKSKGDEPDKFDYKDFTFYRGRLQLLKDAHFAIAIGGSPNSGKSTTAASLFYALNREIETCRALGLIEKSEVRVDLVDLDLVSPTASQIASGVAISRGSKRSWNDELVRAGVDQLRASINANNIVIADLPGGIPDKITSDFAGLAHFSFLVERGWKESAKPWKTFLLGPDLPVHLIHAHTRKEENRKGGMRVYDSRTLRHGNQNFLYGRIVNPNRVILTDNIFIDFASKVLLYDYLPEAILRQKRYKRKLLASLGDKVSFIMLDS